MNVQVLADPAGPLVWGSPALLGSVHDIKAARHHDILTALKSAGVMAFADTAYQGSPANVRTLLRSSRQDPITRKMKPLSAGERAANAAHARIRAIGERANAQLKKLAHPAQDSFQPQRRHQPGQGRSTLILAS